MGMTVKEILHKLQLQNFISCTNLRIFFFAIIVFSFLLMSVSGRPQAPVSMSPWLTPLPPMMRLVEFGEFICPDAGFYPKQNDCSSYYQCFFQNMDPIGVYSCPYGQQFDPVQRQCNLQKVVNCQECTVDGSKKKDPMSPNSYIVCSNGYRTKGFCDPLGHIFSEKLGQCIPSVGTTDDVKVTEGPQGQVLLLESQKLSTGSQNQAFLVALNPTADTYSGADSANQNHFNSKNDTSGSDGTLNSKVMSVSSKDKTYFQSGNDNNASQIVTKSNDNERVDNTDENFRIFSTDTTVLESGLIKSSTNSNSITSDTMVASQSVSQTQSRHNESQTYIEVGTDLGQSVSSSENNESVSESKSNDTQKNTQVQAVTSEKGTSPQSMSHHHHSIGREKFDDNQSEGETHSKYSEPTNNSAPTTHLNKNNKNNSQNQQHQTIQIHDQSLNLENQNEPIASTSETKEKLLVTTAHTTTIQGTSHRNNFSDESNIKKIAKIETVGETLEENIKSKEIEQQKMNQNSNQLFQTDENLREIYNEKNLTSVNNITSADETDTKGSESDTDTNRENKNKITKTEEIEKLKKVESESSTSSDSIIVSRNKNKFFETNHTENEKINNHTKLEQIDQNKIKTIISASASTFVDGTGAIAKENTTTAQYNENLETKTEKIEKINNRNSTIDQISSLSTNHNTSPAQTVTKQSESGNLQRESEQQSEKVKSNNSSSSTENKSTLESVNSTKIIISIANSTKESESSYSEQIEDRNNTFFKENVKNQTKSTENLNNQINNEKSTNNEKDLQRIPSRNENIYTNESIHDSNSTERSTKYIEKKPIVDNSEKIQIQKTGAIYKHEEEAISTNSTQNSSQNQTKIEIVDSLKKFTILNNKFNDKKSIRNTTTDEKKKEPNDSFVNSAKLLINALKTKSTTKIDEDHQTKNEKVIELKLNDSSNPESKFEKMKTKSKSKSSPETQNTDTTIDEDKTKNIQNTDTDTDTSRKKIKIQTTSTFDKVTKIMEEKAMTNTSETETETETETNSRKNNTKNSVDKIESGDKIQINDTTESKKKSKKNLTLDNNTEPEESPNKNIKSIIETTEISNQTIEKQDLSSLSSSNNKNTSLVTITKEKVEKIDKVRDKSKTKTKTNQNNTEENPIETITTNKTEKPTMILNMSNTTTDANIIKNNLTTNNNTTNGNESSSNSDNFFAEIDKENVTKNKKKSTILTETEENIVISKSTISKNTTNLLKTNGNRRDGDTESFETKFLNFKNSDLENIRKFKINSLSIGNISRVNEATQNQEEIINSKQSQFGTQKQIQKHKDGKTNHKEVFIERQTAQTSNDIINATKNSQESEKHHPDNNYKSNNTKPIEDISSESISQTKQQNIKNETSDDGTKLKRKESEMISAKSGSKITENKEMVKSENDEIMISKSKTKKSKAEANAESIVEKDSGNGTVTNGDTSKEMSEYLGI